MTLESTEYKDQLIIDSGIQAWALRNMKKGPELIKPFIGKDSYDAFPTITSAIARLCIDAYIFYEAISLQQVAVTLANIINQGIE